MFKAILSCIVSFKKRKQEGGGGERGGTEGKETTEGERRERGEDSQNREGTPLKSNPIVIKCYTQNVH